MKSKVWLVGAITIGLVFLNSFSNQLPGWGIPFWSSVGAISISSNSSQAMDRQTLEALGTHTLQIQAVGEQGAEKQELDRQPLTQGVTSGFNSRRLYLLNQLANTNLHELNSWQQRNQISDPHKYLLPVILARLSQTQSPEATQELWQLLEKLHQQQPNLYHFRSIFDIRIFFQARQILPPALLQIYQQMVEPPQVLSWLEQGTENHMFMQRLSGLALLDGSGWQSSYPAVAATNEAWLRAEIGKFLTIGQGEFNSSTYTGYSIAGLLNLYDFAKTPELKTLAKAGLDWLAANMALRYSWGTMGGAESRGYDRGTGDGSGLSAIAWLWWGGVEAPEIPNNYARVALIPALSSYRPPSALAKLAQKEIPLPFLLHATHPAYYSYHQAQQFAETFYITPDYSLGTLLVPHPGYQTKGTINAQYATYKLVIRALSPSLSSSSAPSSPSTFPPSSQPKNPVITLGGTFHSPLATGASPGAQYLQSQGTVLYQLNLNASDLQAGVPPISHLVLPLEIAPPQRSGLWYVWRIEGVWLAARLVVPSSPEPHLDVLVQQIKHTPQGSYQIWEAQGQKLVWITEVAALRDYPTWEDLTVALAQTEVDDRLEEQGMISYRNLQRDLLTISAQQQDNFTDWQVISSPYINETLRRGVLSIDIPGFPAGAIDFREVFQFPSP
jgi:hypothetical protein